MKQIIILLLFYFLYNILAYAIISVCYTIFAVSSGDVQAGASSSLPLEWILCLTTLFVLIHLYVKGYVPRRRTSWSFVGWKFMGWLAVAYVGNFGFMDGIAYVLPHLENTLETQFQELAHNPIGAIDLVFVGPLMEELLFRVAILGLLLRRFKPWIAITVSALIFALVHWNPEQSVYALLMGSFLAWIYYRTQSIMPGLVLHVVNNGMSWLTIYTGEDKAYYTFEALGLNAVGAVLFVVGSTALLAYAIWQLYRASIGMQAHKDASASPSTVVRCCESETNVLSDQSDQ